MDVGKHPSFPADGVISLGVGRVVKWESFFRSAAASRQRLSQ